jgi:murein DD-endopeptidase MepM/ murein hydrolase activator NlpD
MLPIRKVLCAGLLPATVAGTLLAAAPLLASSARSAGVGSEELQGADLRNAEVRGAADRTAEEKAREEAKKRRLQDAETAFALGSTPSIFPTKSTNVTSAFGYRKDPFTRRSAYHRGIDFAGDVDDPIYATAAGKVIRSGHHRSMGNYVFVSHGNGLETIYMHLNKVLVHNGQEVKKGQIIGRLGSTGRSTGPHLHYEVHKHGKPVNPKKYLLEEKY